MNTYKSRIHPVVRGGAGHWTSHAFLSTSSIAKRGSPGTLVGSQGKSGGEASGVGGNPLTAPITVYDAISILPIDPTLARLYRQVRVNVRVIARMSRQLRVIVRMYRQVRVMVRMSKGYGENIGL